MNFYIITEGQVENAVYSKWIPFIDNNLKKVESIDELSTGNNRYLLFCGFGYPNYLAMIESAIEDIQNLDIRPRLIVCVDSEEMSKQEKLDELRDYIEKIDAPWLDYKLVVQHCCFESLALGNAKYYPKDTQDDDLIKLKEHFDIGENDPELLPEFGDLNRAQTALLYLRRIISNKGKGCYSKSNPDIVAHKKYYEQLSIRANSTGHIQSFNCLVNAFGI